MIIKILNSDYNNIYSIDMEKRKYINECIEIKDLSFPARIFYFDNIYQALINIGKLKPTLIVANLNASLVDSNRLIELLNNYSKIDKFELIISIGNDQNFTFIL